MGETQEPTLTRTYKTLSGRTGGEFDLPSGQHVTLEPHETSVTLGWSEERNIGAMATAFTALGETAKTIIFDKKRSGKDTKFEFGTLDPATLGIVLRGLYNPKLVRIELAQGASIVWDRSNPEDPNAIELSVLSTDWESTGDYARRLGSEEVGSRVIQLVAMLPETS